MYYLEICATVLYQNYFVLQNLLKNMISVT